MSKKQEILKLREEGKNYREIVNITGFSKSLISYYCGENQKEKSTNRTRIRRQDNVLLRKIETFKDRTKKFRSSIGGDKRGKSTWKFSYNEVIEKFDNNQICYLSGRVIDFSKPKTYSFDHIIPVSKGGTYEIENLGLTCKEANQAKSDLLVDDFLRLCKDVLIHNGYIVKRK